MVFFCSWLHRIGLAAYTNSFQARGLTYMYQLHEITPQVSTCHDARDFTSSSCDVAVT